MLRVFVGMRNRPFFYSIRIYQKVHRFREKTFSLAVLRKKQIPSGRVRRIFEERFMGTTVFLANVYIEKRACRTEAFKIEIRYCCLYEWQQ